MKVVFFHNGYRKNMFSILKDKLYLQNVSLPIQLQSINKDIFLIVHQFVNKLQITNIKFIFHSKKPLFEWTSAKNFCKIHSLCKTTPHSVKFEGVCVVILYCTNFSWHICQNLSFRWYHFVPSNITKTKNSSNFEPKTYRTGRPLLRIVWKRQGEKTSSQWECETFQNSSIFQQKVAPFPSPSLPHLGFGLHKKGNVLSDFDGLFIFWFSYYTEKRTY